MNLKSAILKKQKPQGWGEIIVRDHLTEQRYDRGEAVRGNSMSESPEVGEYSPCLRSREAAREAGRQGENGKGEAERQLHPVGLVGFGFAEKSWKRSFYRCTLVRSWEFSFTRPPDCVWRRQGRALQTPGNKADRYPDLADQGLLSWCATTNITHQHKDPPGSGFLRSPVIAFGS